MALVVSGLPEGLVEGALTLGGDGRGLLLRHLAALDQIGGVAEIVQLVLEVGAGQLDADQAQEFVAAILALSNAASATRHLDIDDLTSALARSTDLQRAVRELPGAADDLARFLSSLAHDPQVRLCARGNDLAGEYDRVFKASRSFTDLRPVMGDEPTAVPAAAVVVEVLQLEVWSRTGSNETLRIALDDHDLESLAATIERARRKRAGVRVMLTRSGVPEIQVSSPSTDPENSAR